MHMDVTSRAFTTGQTVALERFGLEKNAGLRDALSVALTGRVPLRHGTSVARAGEILEKGLVPHAAKGVSEQISGLTPLQENLTFLTRSPANAKMYGAQQAALEHAPALREKATGQYNAVMEKVRPLAHWFLPDKPGAQKALNQLYDVADRVLPAMPDLAFARHGMQRGLTPAGRVLEARVPRAALRAAETTSPEAGRLKTTWDAKLNEMVKMLDLHDNPALDTARELPGAFAGAPFMQDVVHQGPVPAQYFKGSPHYQGPSLGEIRDHLRSAIAEPGEYVKDVGRAFTGISHRPRAIPRPGMEAMDPNAPAMEMLQKILPEEAFADIAPSLDPRAMMVAKQQRAVDKYVAEHAPLMHAAEQRRAAQALTPEQEAFQRQFPHIRVLGGG